MDPRRLAAVGTAFVIALGALSASPAAAQGSAGREAVATGLAWPVSFAFVPGEGNPGFPAGTILYSERLTGNLRAIVRGRVLPDPVANVTVSTAGERGLLGLALHPDFAALPWVYAYHTYFNATAGREVNRVVRWWFGPGAPPPSGPPTPEVVLDGIPAFTVHNGGILGFAPDGTLFITTGDAGNPGGAQDNGTLAGKVLRVNPGGAIPSSNPIPGSPVYTLGHRNVFGLAFHPATGTPYVSENGPTMNDEVNVLERGGNYGWPVVTGKANDPRFVNPIVTFRTVIAPTGLAFYTGDVSPAWRGRLFLGDWNRGELHQFEPVGPELRAVEVVDSVGVSGILDVEDGPDGYLYFSTPDAIYRVHANPPEPALWAFVLGLIAAAVLVTIVSLVVWRRRRLRPEGRAPRAPPP